MKWPCPFPLLMTRIPGKIFFSVQKCWYLKVTNDLSKGYWAHPPVFKRQLFKKIVNCSRRPFFSLSQLLMMAKVIIDQVRKEKKLGWVCINAATFCICQTTV